MKISYEVSPQSLKELEKQFEMYKSKVITKVVRKAGSQWIKFTKAEAIRNISWDDPTMRKSIKGKVYKMKRGKGYFVGVGVEAGKAVGLMAGGRFQWIATRGRWYEDGWTPYPKGKKSGKTGRDWRAGLTNQGGPKVYKTNFIKETADRCLPLFMNYLLEAFKQHGKTTKGSTL